MPTENKLPEGYREMADRSQAEEIADEGAIAVQGGEEKKAPASEDEDDAGAGGAQSGSDGHE